MEKLIRDNVPEVARVLGQELQVRVARGPEERFKFLRAKLIEEATEALNAPVPELLGELADLTEVIENLVHAAGHSVRDLERERARKHRVMGGFREGYILHMELRLEDVED